MRLPGGRVSAVSCNDVYSFTKPVRDEIVLVAGLGVEGDVHAGVHVKHRSRVRADPTQPNMRQVHLMQRELFEEVGEKGYAVTPGQLGENVTTTGLDLLALPVGTILRFGDDGAEAAEAAGVDPGKAGDSPSDGPGRGTAAAAVVDVPGAAVAGVAGEFGVAGAGVAGEFGAAGAGVAGEFETAGAGVAGEFGAAGAGVADVPWAAGAAVSGVLAVAAAATLDAPTARAAAAIEAAVGRDQGGDPRPAVILAGLRNPCAQINGFRPGLLKEVIAHDEEGNLIRKAGVMAVVLRGGPVRPGDPVTVELPPSPHAPLERV